MIQMNAILAAGTVALMPVLGFAQSVQDEVDALSKATKSEIAELGFVPIVQIDHARLAAEVGVEMPPAIVQIFSSPQTNTKLLSDNIRAGLDLPYRVLSFAQGSQAQQVFTSSAFLRMRHDLSDTAALTQFDLDLNGLTSGMAVVPTTDLSKDYGVIELQSPYDVGESVTRLKTIVMGQGDTVWFADIDFRAEAAALGVNMPPATLLLFGGPAPGGVAMRDFPAIGLDAFCQKLLVYQDSTGQTRVIYNDIAAMAELHYGQSAEPHKMLNQRLTQTFKAALE